MNSRDFCYWLKGFIEVNEADKGINESTPSWEQWLEIKEHLSKCFNSEIRFDTYDLTKGYQFPNNIPVWGSLQNLPRGT